MAGLPPVSLRPVGVLLQVCRHVQPEAPTCVCMSWPYQAGHMQPSQAAIPKPLLAHPAHKPQQVLKVVSQQLGLETQLTAEHLLYLFLMHSKIKQLCKFFFSLFLGEKVRKKKSVPNGLSEQHRKGSFIFQEKVLLAGALSPSARQTWSSAGGTPPKQGECRGDQMPGAAGHVLP